MTEIELNNKVEEAKSFFNLNVRMHELIAFHKVYCNKFDIKREFSVADVKYLLSENEDARKLALEFTDNVSIQALLNYCNAEKEYYKFINEKYN